MRKIDGFVFAADFGNVEHLFGKRVNNFSSEGDYENLSGNGLTPYDLLIDARKGAIDFRHKRKDIKKIELGQISVEMAETQEEAEKEFRRATNLVVVCMPVWGVNRDYHFMGPASGKINAYPIPGAYLRDTNYKIFRREKGMRSPFERVRYLASEALRQGACEGGGVTIARFKLRRLEEI